MKSRNKNHIMIRGARVHNLKNISLELPRNKLIVFTGVSGSGKSSLAFDTIYAEGQRRFVESLSSYARQFLERMDRPDVDSIQGISPSIAIEQRTPSRNPRSTVGTMTEIYDYLRLLFARVGKTYCPVCGKVIRKDSVRTVIEKLKEEVGDRGERMIYVSFPIHRHEDTTIRQEIENLKHQGFSRILHGNEIIDMNEKSFPAGAELPEVSVLVGRFVFKSAAEGSEVTDSIETAFMGGGGYVIIKFPDSGKAYHFSQHYECSGCKIRFEEPNPLLFSFNNPFGACSKCQGFGRAVGIDMDLIVPNKDLALRDGAIQPWTTPKWHRHLQKLLGIAGRANIRVDIPFKELTKRELDVIVNGYEDFDGIDKFFKHIEKKSYKIYYRVLLSRYRGYTTCDLCSGARLRREALNIRIESETIHDVVCMTIEQSSRFFDKLKLSDYDIEIGRRILEELKKRFSYLVGIGIGYLTLDRLSNTLSGGESQRINLATALGSSLVGSIYILDEPTVGLHPSDNDKLIAILRSIRDIGNTVIVVEHDADMIKAADVVIDIGPHAGEYGGEIVFKGDYRNLLKSESSVTGKYLSGKKSIAVHRRRKKVNDKEIKIRGAREHNLRSIDVAVPLNLLVAVTGVSGSGKSTLIHEILYSGLKRLKGTYTDKVGAHRAIVGADLIDNVELVDQSPIGKTGRSNPSTYIKAFDLIRHAFAGTPAARMRGYMPGYFSFNVHGGRCETCEGSGVQTVEMQFLADIELICEVCKGKRFKKEVLDIRYHGKNVVDVLSMTVTEAVHFFNSYAGGKRISKRLQVLDDVGLGYVRLGQSATTLSGGEAQRVKLASHLTLPEKGKQTLFIFDEPTTGLHFDDIAKLLKCFDALIEKGNSVVVIEHNMEVVKCADWIIDLGPGAGDRGGEVVSAGTPEDVTGCRESYTGRFLKKYL